jgi:hypothetical protein
MSIIRVTTIQNVAGSKSVPTDTVVDGSAKAWVSFNGSGTVAIRSSFNVSSITDNSTGDYTVTFTNAMTNSDYLALVTTSTAPSGTGTSMYTMIADDLTARTASAVRILSLISNGSSYFDCSQLGVAIFR